MNEGEKPKILLVADYSNFHATLAKGLRNLGCDVTLVSDGGSFMKCERDIDISRKHKGKLGGLLYASKLYRTAKNRMTGFDIVSFRDPAFLDLKPARIKWFFKLIADSNPSCFLSYLSTDLPYLDMLESTDSPLRYSEWFIDGSPNRMRIEEKDKWDSWHAAPMRDLNNYFYGRMKGAVTALYEYHLAAQRVFPADKIAYGGIPIDVDNIEFKVTENPERVRIFLARDHRRKREKGSDLLEIAARNVVERHPDKAEFVLVENVSRDLYMKTMTSCHLLLDQMYSYTPATMALEGMASGLTVITGAEKEFYDFIGEKDNFPMLNSPIALEPLEKCIEELVMKPGNLIERGKRGREFVVKHNHMDKVAGRFLNFWIANA